MRSSRLFLPGARAGATVEAGSSAYRHQVRVLRRKVGDEVLILDGNGRTFEGRIVGVDAPSRRIQVAVGAEIEPPPLALLPVTVAVAIPRGAGMELAIRLASETGLTRIQPLLTERTVARPRRGAEKVARWRRITLESARQCQRPEPLAVEDPLDWESFLDSLDAGGPGGGGEPAAWLALPGGPAPEEAGLLPALRAAAPGPPGGPARSLAVALGPEGGFSPGEVEAGLARGMSPVGFPAPVLRTPTAVVYVGALASLA